MNWNTIKRILRRKLIGSKPNPIIQNESGVFYRTHLNLEIFSSTRSILNYNFKEIFERKIYDFDCANDSPLLIDAGANIGLATLYWKSKFPNSRIVAFEPSTKVFELLSRNVSVNKLTQVQCVNMALSDTEGDMQFTTDEGVSGSLVVKKNLSSLYTVRTTKLSNYISETVELLKLDIEGAELQVMEEIASRLHLVKRLFVEYHSFVHKEQDLSRLLQTLESAGFRYYIENDSVTNSPFNGFEISLGQDLKLNIWAFSKDTV